MHIGVIGTGYVGLVTGTCFSETGNNVICMDVDQRKLDMLNNGKVPIFEPGLDTLVHKNTENGRLTFSDSLEDTLKKSEVLFLALPTPPREDGSADLKYVLQVAEDIGKLLANTDEYKLIVSKSTVPVGTTLRVKEVIKKHAGHDNFDVASNPEFLREGYAVEDFLKPERVVVGCSSDKVKDLFQRMYKPFLMSGNPLLFMDEHSAEITKYAANSFLATKISFMNEVANLCEIVGADVDKVRIGMGSDSRIGKRFLFPGVGYGGSCFPKDVKALFYTAKENNYNFKILESVMNVNQLQRGIIVDKVKDFFNNDLNGKKIAIWGIAFKPNTDDIREAPALDIMQALIDGGADVHAYDPEAMEECQRLTDLKITYGKDDYEVLEDADALVIVTEWNEFRTPDFGVIANKMKQNVIFDGRNIFDLKQMEELNFYYNSIGRETINNLK